MARKTFFSIAIAPSLLEKPSSIAKSIVDDPIIDSPTPCDSAKSASWSMSSDQKLLSELVENSRPPFFAVTKLIILVLLWLVCCFDVSYCKQYEAVVNNLFLFYNKKMKHTGREVIKQEAKGLQALAAKLDERTFEAVVSMFLPCRILFLCGVGKSGHVARKLAATMTSLGTPAVFLHPTEAAHGDMGMVSQEDGVLFLSRSGKATELMPLVTRTAELCLPSALISECDDNYLALRVRKTLKIPRVSEAWGHAPTTSTVMQMALGDAIAVDLAERKGYNWESFQEIHPGGALGEVA
jgi:D-arabinose 5-phosphate isomerase GutQ